MKALIFGCGYLGSRVARQWVTSGHTVYAVTRSAEHAEAFRNQSLVPIVADITRPETLHNLPNADVVLFAVGFDRTAGKQIRDVYVTGLQNTLAAISKRDSRFIYISSTGVYGNVSGDWVDEDSPCAPTRDGGQACLDAEKLLTQSPFGKQSVILRMAGIYGPGRLPMQDAIVRGEPLPVPAIGYLNLIHVDDAASITIQVAANRTPSSLYVVADSNPVHRGDYYRFLAELLNAPPPQFASPDSASHAAQRAGSDKRICNKKMMTELKPELRFPSYREGLASIVAAK